MRSSQGWPVVTLAGMTLAGMTLAGMTLAGMTLAGMTLAGMTLAGMTSRHSPRPSSSSASMPARRCQPEPGRSSSVALSWALPRLRRTLEEQEEQEEQRRTAMDLGYVIVFVDDVEEAVEFYEQAFGIVREFVHESGDFAQMATGSTKLAFTSNALGATAVPVGYTPMDRSRPPAGVELTLVTDDVATDFATAVEAGATPLAEPHDTSWGQTVSYVRDHVGTLVSIASPVGA